MELQKIYSNEKGLVTAFAESRIGGRPENQDNYGWKETSLGYLVTVCDGMGGGPGGRTASTIAVNAIISAIDEASKDEETANIIIKAVRRANMEIIQAGTDNPKLKGMGSTATVLLLSENSAFIAHVGDSRVYQLRGHRKVFRTFDHSMVFELVEQGIITEEQARLSAQSNVITRALGIHPDVEVDVVEVPYEKGDRFVLCSDGIHGSMPEEELLKILTNSKVKLGVMIDDVATLVDNIGRSTGGGHDNLTIAIVETKINSKLKQKMSKLVKIGMLGLCVLLFFSVVLNIVQCCGRSGSDVVNDSIGIETLTDSVTKQNKQIEELKKNIKEIGDQAKQICTSNITPVDSINRIVEKVK